MNIKHVKSIEFIVDTKIIFIKCLPFLPYITLNLTAKCVVFNGKKT